MQSLLLQRTAGPGFVSGYDICSGLPPRLGEVVGGISRQQARFWMNLQLEALAGNQRALEKTWDLGVRFGSVPYEGELDRKLIETEIARVLDCVARWEEMFGGRR
jgi:hypothetical protein